MSEKAETNSYLRARAENSTTTFRAGSALRLRLQKAAATLPSNRPRTAKSRRPTATRTATKQNDLSVSSGHFACKSFIILVPGGGVEPPRGCPRRILSPLRLPVPPSRRSSSLPQNAVLGTPAAPCRSVASSTIPARKTPHSAQQRDLSANGFPR